MNVTNKENPDERFGEGESVLDYSDTDRCIGNTEVADANGA